MMTFLLHLTVICFSSQTKVPENKLNICASILYGFWYCTNCQLSGETIKGQRVGIGLFSYATHCFKALTLWSWTLLESKTWEIDGRIVLAGVKIMCLLCSLRGNKRMMQWWWFCVGNGWTVFFRRRLEWPICPLYRPPCLIHTTQHPPPPSSRHSKQPFISQSYLQFAEDIQNILQAGQEPLSVSEWVLVSH